MLAFSRACSSSLNGCTRPRPGYADGRLQAEGLGQDDQGKCKWSSMFWQLEDPLAGTTVRLVLSLVIHGSPFVALAKLEFMIC